MVADSIPDNVISFLCELLLRAHYGPEVHAASAGKENQEYSWDKGRPASNAGSLNAICEQIF
jgi:hypothetical protein